MAAESGLDPATGGYADDDEPQALGYLTGTSTPGYREEGGECLHSLLPAGHPPIRQAGHLIRGYLHEVGPL